MKKNLLAILLTVCMVLSMVPAALAADSVFTDVKADDWFAEEVEYVYDNGLMNGVGNDKFDPNGNVTRAMMWTTLARIAGENTTGSDPWWLAGQQWAMKAGVSDGTMATNNITREQLVTMLYRYAQLKGYDVSVGEDTNILSYTDAFDMNEWAIAAMQWACGAGIINGIDGALQPQGYATRAQLAAILYRFVEAVPATHTVTFMWNYGNKGVYETVEVEDGKTVGSLKNPSRSDYTFSGWYTADGDRFTLHTKVTEDIVVYAKWMKYTYVPSHTHSYSDWTANDDGTHTKYCSCGKTKTEVCAFGKFVSNENGTHARTCLKCSGVETQNCVYTDHVCGNCGHDVSDGVTILYPQETAGENYTMLKAAIDAAQDGDVIYLGAGTFELQTVLEINNKSISIVGVEDSVVLKNTRTNKGHLFTIKNHTDPENNPQVVMTNITLDQNNNPSGHGIYVRGSVTVDLYDVVITNATAASIIMDHAYAYADGNYYDGTRIVVNAYNVDLDADGFVQMGALPMASVANVTTYAEFNYDSESTIPSFKADGYNRGYGNLTVNGEPVYPDVYFIEEDGITYLKDTVNEELTLWKIPADYTDTTLNIKEGVTAIGGYAFAYNSNIETIVLPSTVTTLNDRAFRDTSASTVVLNEGLTNISYQAFRNATNVKSVEIPSTVTTISKEAFQNSGIETLTIPATVKTLEYGACRDMKELETVTIESNADIPIYAFRACTNLKTVYLNGDNVTFGGGSKGMIFTNKENGDGSAITIYVKNETVKERLLAADTAAKDYSGYKIVVFEEVAEGVLKAGEKTYEIISKDGLMNLQSVLTKIAPNEANIITVDLRCDVDLTGEEWAPIVSMWVTFNGNEHTISNLTAGFDSTGRRSGFWSYAGAVTINDLILENVNVTGSQAGILAGSGEGFKANNCVVKGTNTVTFASGVETWNGIGAITGVLTGSNVNVTIAEGATVTLKRGSMTTAYGCKYVDDLTGHISANNGTVTNNGTVIANGTITYIATSNSDLAAMINSATGTTTIALAAGEYKMPSSGTSANITITGSKDVVIDNTLGAYLDSATLTFEGVSFKVGTGYANGNGSDYAALYSPNVTYIGCDFSGPFRIGRDGASFTNCNFKDLGNDYVWTYGNDATFIGCTFNTDGKSILIYSDGGNEVSKVSVTGCTFNATAGAKAGAIANQNCAAIEIHNYGNGVNLTTSGNTIGQNFSGEWRIKTYENGKPAVIVNGTTYTTIAIDGKTMTIDSSKNVTVNE